jgi:hypothetical protein
MYRAAGSMAGQMSGEKTAICLSSWTMSLVLRHSAYVDGGD